VRQKYGHIAQIITFGTMEARAVIRDVGRVMDVPLGDADKLAKLVPNEQGDALIENPYQFWDQISPNLPHRKIVIYGPPISSGTRDAFEEIVMQYQTEEMKVYRDAGLKGYRIIRSDGAYIPSGENDNLIVKKLTRDLDAFGIFGYSFLTENSDLITGVDIDEVPPTSESIASKQYPISRSLFFYTKNSHLDKVPAMREYVDMFLSYDLIGEDGLLTEIGLIPLSLKLIDDARARLGQSHQLTLEALQAGL
jgi:phosphate transport system substrate-binding protein